MGRWSVVDFVMWEAKFVLGFFIGMFCYIGGFGFLSRMPEVLRLQIKIFYCQKSTWWKMRSKRISSGGTARSMVGMRWKTYVLHCISFLIKTIHYVISFLFKKTLTVEKKVLHAWSWIFKDTCWPWQRVEPECYYSSLLLKWQSQCLDGKKVFPGWLWPRSLVKWEPVSLCPEADSYEFWVGLWMFASLLCMLYRFSTRLNAGWGSFMHESLVRSWRK